MDVWSRELDRTLLRPLHPLTWYGSTCRNSAPLSGKRASMKNRLLTSFSVFSLFCSGYLSHVKVSVLFYQRVIFCCPVGAVYLGVLFLVRVISMDPHYANFPLTCKPLKYGAVHILSQFCFFFMWDYFFYPVDKALLPTPNRSLKQCGFAGVPRGRLSALGIFKILGSTQVYFP